MAKYHISPKTGAPGVCRARTRPCPIGGEGDHYESKEKALEALEEKAAQEYPTTTTLKKTAQPNLFKENDEELAARMEEKFGRRYKTPLRYLSHPMSANLMREVLRGPEGDHTVLDDYDSAEIGLAAGKAWKENKSDSSWDKVRAITARTIEIAEADNEKLERMLSKNKKSEVSPGVNEVTGEHYDANSSPEERFKAMESTFKEAEKEGLLPSGITYEFETSPGGALGPQVVIRLYGVGREASDPHDRDMISDYGMGVRSAIERLSSAHNKQRFYENERNGSGYASGNGFQPVVWLQD